MWKTKTTYIDISTGELLNFLDVTEKRYYIINTKKIITQPDRTKSLKIKHIIHECKRTIYKQLTIW